MTHILSERDGGWITAGLQIEPWRFMSALTHIFERVFLWGFLTTGVSGSLLSVRRLAADSASLYFQGVSLGKRKHGVFGGKNFRPTLGRLRAPFPRSGRNPLKTSTVLSAINIAVLNLWMSDEGIEADPDESMNEWWWLDWKSRTVRGGRWRRRERVCILFISALRKRRFDTLKIERKKKSTKWGRGNTPTKQTHSGGGPLCISVEPPANCNRCVRMR